MKLDQSDLNAIGNLFDQKFDEKVKPIKKKLNSIEKKLDTTIGFFDLEVTRLGKRVDRLESHTGLPPFPIDG